MSPNSAGCSRQSEVVLASRASHATPLVPLKAGHEDVQEGWRARASRKRRDRRRLQRSAEHAEPCAVVGCEASPAALCSMTARSPPSRRALTTQVSGSVSSVSRARTVASEQHNKDHLVRPDVPAPAHALLPSSGPATARASAQRAARLKCTWSGCAQLWVSRCISTADWLKPGSV